MIHSSKIFIYTYKPFRSTTTQRLRNGNLS